MRKRLILLSAIAGTVALGFACATGREGIVSFTPVDCPGFVVVPRTIEVGSTGGTFLIQPNHELYFAAGAVPDGSRYEVLRGRPGHAEIDIEPLDDSPREFEADVILQLSYAGCPSDVTGSPDPLKIVRTTSPAESYGGADKKDRRHVRAIIPHLTAFAIAN